VKANGFYAYLPRRPPDVAAAVQIVLDIDAK